MTELRMQTLAHLKFDGLRKVVGQVLKILTYGGKNDEMFVLFAVIRKEIDMVEKGIFDRKINPLKVIFVLIFARPVPTHHFCLDS